MATIINNPGSERMERAEPATSVAGWTVAVILLIAIIAAGAYVWSRYRGTQAPAGETNINVTIPNPTGSGENTVGSGS